jgi:hypothetical protein
MKTFQANDWNYYTLILGFDTHSPPQPEYTRSTSYGPAECTNYFVLRELLRFVVQSICISDRSKKVFLWTMEYIYVRGYLRQLNRCKQA